jgi:hypothetical protein
MLSTDSDAWTEGRIRDEVLTGKSARERITQAVSAVLEEAKVDVTALPDGSYQVHARARQGQAGCCHGREDLFDLSGIATVKGKAISVTLTGVDRIVEDTCNPNGNGRIIDKRILAKATLRIAKPF